ncbi:MAG: FHA domain-containing protein [Bacteroidaceae bacterium]|nr:FHA domain-containing protein [Bacteroidaceae bacterium]
MIEEKKRVKCPVCGAILKIRYEPAFDAKSLKCPICGSVSKFISYQQLPLQSVANDETDYRKDEGSIGALTQVGNGRRYQLKIGSNTIGRKATTSNTQIQIETNDLYMSRNHAEIIVSTSNNGFLHYFKNAQNKNNTYVNEQIIKDGDLLILEGGEIIRMGHTELIFELTKNRNTSDILGEEETDY